jgi:PAS domain S-box-containing protein
LPKINGLITEAVSLADFVDEIPLGIMIVDLHHRVLLLNRRMEALTGYLSAEVHGIPCKYVLRSNLCQEQCLTACVAANRSSATAEADIVNKSREKIPVRFTAAPLLDADGEIVGFVKSVEDIRFLKQSEVKTEHFFFGNLIGNSPEMQRVLRLLPAIAQTDSSVLITGETGTGKDYVAEAIHNASQRAKGPFIKVNCGALPESLLESELFGHQKGAFTGAIDNKPGRFRLANTGTLYLTEIGDLPLALQVKLLSFLDDQVVYPLGSSKGIHVDVRVIAATHRDLESMVRQGSFREDLLFRLNVIRLHLPPLSEREGDAKLLMDHFLHLFNRRFGKKIVKFSEAARSCLVHYPYPGNVRELRNIVEFAVNLCEGEHIDLEHLPIYLKNNNAPKPSSKQFVEAEPPRIVEHKVPVYAVDPGLDWSETERRMIMDAMVRAKGNRAETAKLLGWGRSTLWRKLKHHGIV